MVEWRMMNVGLPAKKTDGRYTYADYLTWPEDERWELINGVAWNMSPAPSTPHQAVLMELAYRLYSFFENRECMVFAAPFDVLLPESADQAEDDVTTVVQPDLSVICDETKITRTGCTSPPEWLIEILSPYTSHKDLHDKLELYERHGVREYWLVDPGNRCVYIYVHGDDSRYGDPDVHVSPAEVRSVVFADFVLDLSKLFDAVPRHLRG